MTSEGLGELFEGDSADMCAWKFPLKLMEGWAEGLACADPGARTPIGASRIFFLFLLPPLFKTIEGVVVGFQILAWAPKTNSKNSEKKIKFGPPPPGPLGAIFRSFLVVFFKYGSETSEGVYSHTKKEILTPQKIWRPPMAPCGSIFRFF